MDCDDIQRQLSALVDGALDDTSRRLVENHLAECDLCRSEQEALIALDVDLAQTFDDRRRQADVVAQRTIEQLEQTPQTTLTDSQSRPVWRRAWGYVLSAAAGFLLAAAYFQPWTNDRQPSVPDSVVREAEHAGDRDGNRALTAAVAHLVHTTGPISYRPPLAEKWVAVDPTQLPILSCPSNSEVRTEPGALCELQTTTGSRIRLNESSEVTFRSNEELELKRGQIWCRAADDSGLRVVTGDASAAPPASAEQWTLACATSSECVTTRSTNEPLQVVSAAGNVNVTFNGSQQTVPPGTLCTLSNGDIEVRESQTDLLDAERWMQPLLTMAGHGNPELTRRVDALLAGIGRTKLGYLYEQDLRNLGEFGALPLLKFVQSVGSRQEPARRQAAMNIVADVAAIWMVPDLIGLLEDDDPLIRTQTARGLTRLTGETQGLSPEDWSAERSTLTAGVSDWQRWWAQHRYACAVPPQDVTPTWNKVQ